MNNKFASQSGFTLVEIAIVLVVIGLLLGGVLKGQELINSAKTKNMASDFRNVQVMIYAYQDKYRKIPGDDNGAATRFSPNLAVDHQGDGNGVIGGNWNDTVAPSESILAWEHIRRANLASGSTDFSNAMAIANALPSNSEGGRFGISGTKPIANMAGGNYYACSDGIEGKLATQLDVTLDDGLANTGAMMAIAQAGNVTAANGTNAASTNYVEGTRYTVCMAY